MHPEKQRSSYVMCAEARARSRQLLFLLAVAACGDPPAPPAAGADAPEAAQASSLPSGAPASHTITLITGDRVTLQEIGQARPMTRIDRGPGRERVTFTLEWNRGELSVIPQDVAALIGSGQLDRALFNVTQLLADGLGDDERADIPLLLTGATRLPAFSTLAAGAGLTLDRSLPTLDVTAARQAKASAGAALATLATLATLAATPPAGAGAKARAAAASPRLWLDRQRKLSLDRSVPQIGAPAAYARGLTGAGVIVAVLDSGIDATHPDLVGKVAAAATFVDDGRGTSDTIGHGTHVASIVAGSGAASGAPTMAWRRGRPCSMEGSAPAAACAPTPPSSPAWSGRSPTAPASST
jgi:hypothetical protein